MIRLRSLLRSSQPARKSKYFDATDYIRAMLTPHLCNARLISPHGTFLQLDGARGIECL
jgi:hypothetical protein